MLTLLFSDDLFKLSNKFNFNKKGNLHIALLKLDSSSPKTTAVFKISAKVAITVTGFN